MNADTIAAIASAAGIGGIGVLRISGPAAPAIARGFLGRTPRPRHAHLCAFRDADGGLIDRGLLLYFPAPHSYTGEAVVELQTHGSRIVLDLLLRRLLQLGARLARPGEFSERAFLNGKLDLVQAEAVADLIESGSEAAARAAQRSLEGAFSERVHALVDAVVRVRVHLEAAIDFPEEEIDFLAAPQLHADLAALQDTHDQLLRRVRQGVRLTDGTHVVIVGRPNAGKSSLLNALAASDRAIVTATAGTTRDLLRETIDLDGIVLTLVDTAGLREASDAIEREGIRRARAELTRADVAILVSEDAHLPDDLALLADVPDSATRLVVHNKIDLGAGGPRHEQHDDAVHLWLSARSGAGVDLLRDELARLAGRDALGGSFSARTRHVDALQRAGSHIAAAREALTDYRAGELAAEELRQAQHVLGEITGQFTSDDLLGAIFSSFCIGK